MSLNDINGYPFGRNQYGRPINLDIWSRESNNMLVVGPTGSGKTVTAKRAILHQFYRGVKIIIIDVHREYKDLCEALGGYWIDGDSDYVDCPSEVLTADLIVIDMNDLRKAKSELIATYYEKVLSWCWVRMTRSVGEKVLLVIENTQQIGVESVYSRIATMYRTCRLYNSGMLLVAMQSDAFICDMAAKTMYTVVTCAGGGRKIDDLVYLCDFSENDIAFMSQRKKWTALLDVGGIKEQVTLEIPEDEKPMILGKRWFSKR